MIFIPGMKPGHVKGAAGSTSKPRRVERLISGSAYRGKATPRNLIPTSDLDKHSYNTDTKARKAKEQRARDVAEAFDAVRDTPNTVKDRLNETYAKAAEVPVED